MALLQGRTTTGMGRLHPFDGIGGSCRCRDQILHLNRRVGDSIQHLRRCGIQPCPKFGSHTRH